MDLIKNIFIVLIVGVILFLIINHFFIRSNIIWDDIVQGQTNKGGIQPSKIYVDNLSNTQLIPLPSFNSIPTSHQSAGFASNMTVQNFVSHSGQSGLIVPNTAFPTMINSNFMFSIWFFIDDYTSNLGNNKYISSIIGTQSNEFSPTLITFLTPYSNNLGIAITTQTSSSNPDLNFYYIENIPLQKWNCLIISVVDRTMDIYLDGKLVNSFILGGFYVPRPRSSLYVGNNTNNYFTGFITRARYANGGVNPQQAYSIYREGINTSFAGDFLNKYRLKVGLYEYNNKIGGFSI